MLPQLFDWSLITEEEVTFKVAGWTGPCGLLGGCPPAWNPLPPLPLDVTVTS
jgi:hypothetical protein